MALTMNSKEDQIPLFGNPPMVRRSDPETSHEAAAVVLPKVGRIQQLVLEVFKKYGPMTARKAERLSECGEYGFSTIRKRISELARIGYLVECGVDRSGKAPATVYKVAEEQTWESR